MLICQKSALDPTLEQTALFHAHAAAARIMRNDLLARWVDEGKRLPGFRHRLGELRPLANRRKFQRHLWMRELSQNAVKGGAIDSEDAIRRYYAKQCRRPKFHGKNARKRFRADNGVSTVRVDGNRLALPAKMGRPVRMLEPLRWPGKGSTSRNMEYLRLPSLQRNSASILRRVFPLQRLFLQERLFQSDFFDLRLSSCRG